MSQWITRSDAVHWYMEELSSHVVAKSGIPSDRHHLGKLIFQSFKDAPDHTLQIDGATDESETFGSALTRSVQCATAMRNLGLKCGDTIVVMSPNHIHFSIPIYAAFYLGITVAVIDMTMGIYDLRETLKNIGPKVVYCQSDRVEVVRSVLQMLKVDTQIVTFDKSDQYLCLFELLKENGSDISVNDFKVADFDPAETILLLIATSGSTGLPKSAAISHKNMVVTVLYLWTNFKKFPMPTRMSVLLSPNQWYSAHFQVVCSPIMRHTRLQSSATLTQKHICYLINKYRKISPKTQTIVIYGMSEVPGLSFNFDLNRPTSLGTPIQGLEYKLINPATLEVIVEANVPGELCLKGPGVFKGYYNNPEATAEILMDDGWLRTGDIMYRDETSYYYYVDRKKLLFKYDCNQISPLEIENVILTHPGVFQVAVSSVPHEYGDLIVACVVPHEGYQITAQEIKSLVKESLSDSKQLRGGVIFLKELPLTSTSKINHPKLAAMVLSMRRE
ncbi:luciferin 4-monooxygenase-like [Melitaea cinxia]|uniref:luciferin 4-monooxygenase-like n=1 Tax=Melitaea cinxia TaxID=113334 RepID=UPI001E26EB2F|nr:luciferin 4-monooxygenase-like [Melitaea cinxia]